MYVIFIGAVYRYYESRMRIYNDSKPSRLAAKKTNEKKNRIRNRQRQVQLLMSVMYDTYLLQLRLQFNLTSCLIL